MKSYLKIFFILTATGIIFLFLISNHVKNIGKELIYQNVENIPNKQTALILGARVYNNGRMSDILLDRVKTAIELYQKNKIEKILVSGDHGRESYDEVNAIKDYLLEKEIPSEIIFLDHAGFDTYDSIYRAKEIFQINSLIIVTQKFHLPRALYIAQKLKIETLGIVADKHTYINSQKNELREILARFKAYLNITFHSKPKFLGDIILIAGDNSLSWD